MLELGLLAVVFFAVAVVYGSVGNAGASGYLAVLALAGFPPERTRPVALVANVVVAGLAAWNFARSGRFHPKQALPVVLGSAPAAFLGGLVDPTTPWVRPLVAAVLLLASARALLPRPASEEATDGPRVPVVAGVVLGAAIGAVSGVTGTGGGILLVPAMVALGWASVRQSAGISALFILANSLAALAGISVGSDPVPLAEVTVLATAAGLGGFVGSWLGANHLPERPLSIALGVVLAVAAVRMALG